MLRVNRIAYMLQQLGKYGDIPCNKWFHNWRASLFCCSFGVLVKVKLLQIAHTCMITRFRISKYYFAFCLFSVSIQDQDRNLNLTGLKSCRGPCSVVRMLNKSLVYIAYTQSISAHIICMLTDLNQTLHQTYEQI